MDYYESVVVEYLRADRAIFVNVECRIDVPPVATPHWFCDIAAVDFSSSTVFLCEVTYDKSLQALLKRMQAWNKHWAEIKAGLVKNSAVPEDWNVRAWVFIPEQCVEKFVAGVKKIGTGPNQTRCMPDPRITTLEAVAPWNYRESVRKGEDLKFKESIPDEMRV